MYVKASACVFDYIMIRDLNKYSADLVSGIAFLGVGMSKYLVR